MAEGESRINRAIVVVLDSVGVGGAPDAAAFGDHGADTLGHVAERVGGLTLPHLQRLGLGNIAPINGVPPSPSPLAAHGAMTEISAGKDTITGHWEIMGLVTQTPFPTFPRGFPPEILDQFFRATGVRRVLGNKTASGTEIIQELGVEHMETGHPILYTSADSVFQLAAHEGVIPVPGLYAMCEKARRVCDPYRIGRVIARPFVGTAGHFVRTANRRDIPMPPPGETALDRLKKKGFPVTGIGKIEDIFAGRGLTRSLHTTDNRQGMECLEAELAITTRGLIFINLVDFDMLYGHRNDAPGYAAALEAFDRFLGRFLPGLKGDDLLVITADHGCDPGFPGTDHTREQVPVLVYGETITPRDLGTRRGFSDVAVTLMRGFGIDHDFAGKSMIR